MSSRFRRFTSVNWQYAMGEISIIVVGILIALALDSCNDSRVAANRERDYLRRLAADVRRDTAMFAFTDSLLDGKEQALAAVDSVLSRELPLRDTVAFLHAFARSSNLGWNQPRVRPITFQDLLSTGNLRLISDLELRTSIVEYYRAAEGSYDRIRSRVPGYAQRTYELLPRRAEFEYAGPLSGPGLAQLTITALDPELRPLLTAEQNFARFIRQQNSMLRENALQLLRQLE
jgi:hypothetical protein